MALSSLLASLFLYRSAADGRFTIDPRIDNRSLDGKVIVGYQGWFACPSDKTGVRNWGHWQQANGRPAVDMLPAMREIPRQFGCDAPWIKDMEGRSTWLFSSQNPLVVDKHIEWLADYGISGVAVQTFATSLAFKATTEARDVVLDNIKAASEKYGRVFYVAYDISGAKPDWPEIIRQDWNDLESRGILKSPSYLHQGGKPIVQIWGAGWPDRPSATPERLQDAIEKFNTGPNPASVLLGVPGWWRTLPDRWLHAFAKAFGISPWSIGMYRSIAQANRFDETVMHDDLQYADAHKQMYMPVVFPGFSAWNRSNGKEPFAEVPRACGGFLKTQIEAVEASDAKSAYVAMFDEANEGTAIFKTSSNPSQDRMLPAEVGCNRDGDLYLRLVGSLAAHLRQK